jgi:hypothetical protein
MKLKKLTSDFPCDLIPCWHLETEDNFFKINQLYTLYRLVNDIEKISKYA